MKIAMLILMLFASCGCMAGHRDEQGRFLPNRPAWRLSDQSLHRSADLHYDSVYIGDFYAPRTAKFKLLKFWPDGHFMMRWSDSDDPNQMNSSDSASVGYFYTEGTRLITENFATINAGQYGYSVYEILPDGSLLRISHGYSLRKQFEIPTQNRLYPVPHSKNFSPDW